MSARATADDRIRDLLLWLRKERIVCTELTVGDVSLAIQDMVLAGSLMTAPSATPASTDEEAAVRNLYAEYGGKAIDEVAAEEQTTYEDDE